MALTEMQADAVRRTLEEDGPEAAEEYRQMFEMKNERDRMFGTRRNYRDNGAQGCSFDSGFGHSSGVYDNA